MTYRLTCLTPVLVGDGQRLSPIDYMVWKDQVNVLDQRRIFRLLAKGPRLDNYLAQIKKAEKLDFAAWGGFAQNFAGRRVPFENPAYSAYWERAHAELLHIQTFASGLNGPFLPGSAIKGALRAGLAFTRWSEGILRDAATRSQGERPPRNPAQAGEEQALGRSGSSITKGLSVADSAPVPTSVMKIYLLRVATLVSRGDRLELGWKQSPRGAVEPRRVDDSAPVFAEMAAPGTIFEGSWRENTFFLQPEIVRALRWHEAPSREKLFDAANQRAAKLLRNQKEYAERAGLPALVENLTALEGRLAQARESGRSCLLCLGWGAGLLSKTSSFDTDSESYRQILRQSPLYSGAIRSGLPFPKTRKVIFVGNKPATLPGWATLEVEQA